MSRRKITAIECDHEDCDERGLITDGMREGGPLASWLSSGWVEIKHRIPDDHLGITRTHFCPEHAEVHIDEKIFTEQRSE